MSASTSQFAALPGQEIPVGEIPAALANMWETGPSEKSSPSEFRASQLNMIVHFGKDTVPDEAAEIFETAIRFSRRYPSRVIVLCPEDHSRGDRLITAKLFAECHIGKNGRDRSCCEAVMLAYPPAGKNFLENQVSILLDNDLPTYYRIHHFNRARKLADYGFFLKVARRVVYDSACEGLEIGKVEWPKPEAVRDLAHARLLPVRQSVGQFLSAFAPDLLARDLRAVRIAHTKDLGAEARCLGRWLSERLAHCQPGNKTPPPAPDYTASSNKGGDAVGLEIRLDYPDERHFRWTARDGFRCAETEADFGHGPVRLAGAAKLLPPETALAEAFFF